MSAFQTKLQFEDDGGLPFILLAPLVYQSDRLNITVIVPTGFLTDLASIPRGLWNILPPVGKYDRAAVVHDFLYQKQVPGVERGDADATLLEAMALDGVGAFRRRLIYWAVRAGGWAIWRTYRAQETA